MAKAGNPKLPGWDEPPLPISSAEKSSDRPRGGRLSLLHLMVAVLFCAILVWSAKLAYESDGYLEKILTGVVVGLGFCASGLWMVVTMSRYSILGWILFVIGFVIITAAMTGGLAILSLPILIGAVIYLTRRRQANNQDALLWILEVAAEQGMPLGPGIQAFSTQTSGMYQIWAASLAELIHRGVPLPDALDSLPKLVTRRSSLMIRTGWDAGDLASGLKEAGASLEVRQPILHALFGRIAYLAWISTIASSVIGFVLYFIIPKFEAIFHDFGVQLPTVTIAVVKASHFVVDYAWLGTLGFLGILIYGIILLSGPDDFTIPLFDRLFVRRHTATILRSLAIVVSAGKPIPPALFSLSQWYPIAWVRKKLSHAATDASLGHDWATSLHESGLFSQSDLGVLTSAQRAGNLGWALRELAETCERRWNYRLQAWTQIFFVAAMLLFGTMIFFIAVAFFLPLITLIERLA